MPRLSITLLGLFKVERDGKLQTSFRSWKVRALLAYLATESARPWSRSKLAGLLWPDLPERAALSNLRNALSNLGHVLGSQPSNKPYLLISQHALQFNPASDSWLDVQIFSETLSSVSTRENLIFDPDALVRLEQALDLYRGDFLEGFSIDSEPFEEWALIKREQLRQKMLQALRRIAISGYEQSGKLKAFSEYIRRYIELEPWDEVAYRHLMKALAISGQRGAALAQYEACRKRLARDLEIDPEPETTQLFEQIRDCKIDSVSQEQERWAPDVSHHRFLPGFLTRGDQDESEPTLFVARQKEIERLECAYKKAVNGQTGVYFVSGEPGSGKTALLAEFSRRVMRMYPDAIIAWGQCNAFTGQGDPFFPFVSILRMLAGGVEAPVSSGIITIEHARRLWQFMPETIETLLEQGFGLINRFISGRDLLSLARLNTGVKTEQLKHLQVLLKHLSDQPAQPRVDTIDIFEQFSRVISTLGHHRPLILIVDDMQWIDTGSVSLLFHLARSLAGSRVLLLGAYRPEEVALKNDEENDPFQGAVRELQSVYGDIQIDLMQSDGAEFVEALIDSEANELNTEFRDTLYQHTSGNPLFTIELLRGMQLRGDIWRNSKGSWVEGKQLFWEKLPVRVEALIARRISHLPEECQEILSIASVEGEQFTAEIVASILGMNELLVCDLLSKEIGRRHRLVTAQSQQNYSGKTLSLYRFQHSLYQTYLYNQLDVLEKARLHRRIGSELEQIYYQDTEKLSEIAHSLSRNFDAAGDIEKAIHYDTIAGQYALQLSANREAITHFRHALRLLKSLPETEARDRQELDLQLSLGPPLTATKGWSPPELAVAYERSQELCQKISDHSRLIPALWLLATYRLGRSEHTEVDRLVARLYRLAEQAGDPIFLSLANLQISPFYQGKLNQARGLLEGAIAYRDIHQQRFLAQRYGMSPSAVGLAYLANCLWLMGFTTQADQFSREAHELAEKISHPLSTCYVVARACWQDALSGNMDSLQERAINLNQAAQRYGFKNFGFSAVFFQHFANAQGDSPDEADIRKMYQAIEGYHATGTILNRTAFLTLFSQACETAGQTERGLAVIDESIALAKKTGERWYEAESYRVKGELLVRRSEGLTQQETDLKEAENCFTTALSTAKHQNAKSLEQRSATSLYSGEGGIRTHGGPLVSWTTTVFETAPFNRSGTSP
jgi:DNA-binding SARP family transcriptional activator/predicted ATPase